MSILVRHSFAAFSGSCAPGNTIMLSSIDQCHLKFRPQSTVVASFPGCTVLTRESLGMRLFPYGTYIASRSPTLVLDTAVIERHVQHTNCGEYWCFVSRCFVTFWKHFMAHFDRPILEISRDTTPVLRIWHEMKYLFVSCY